MITCDEYKPNMKYPDEKYFKDKNNWKKACEGIAQRGVQKSDDGLVRYPNVQSCIAVCFNTGDSLIGVHLTTAIQNSESEIKHCMNDVRTLLEDGRVRSIYIGGNAELWHSSGWDSSMLLNELQITWPYTVFLGLVPKGNVTDFIFMQSGDEVKAQYNGLNLLPFKKLF